VNLLRLPPREGNIRKVGEYKGKGKKKKKQKEIEPAQHCVEATESCDHLVVTNDRVEG
jgi:hypothetical protein